MLTETAIRLNEAGVAMLTPDLHGTGDSEGSFRDASWNGWLDDLAAIHTWATRQGFVLRGVLAIRSGALLAAQLSDLFSNTLIQTTVLWQPIRSGSLFVKQLLRVRTAASALNAGRRESVDDLASRIAGGEEILVAGYSLTRALVQPLISVAVDQFDCSNLGTMHVIEVTRAAERCGEFSESIGRVTANGVRYFGDPYWSSTEIVSDSNVVSHTVRLFSGKAVHPV